MSLEQLLTAQTSQIAAAAMPVLSLAPVLNQRTDENATRVRRSARLATPMPTPAPPKKRQFGDKLSLSTLNKVASEE